MNPDLLAEIAAAPTITTAQRLARDGGVPAEMIEAATASAQQGFNTPGEQVAMFVDYLGMGQRGHGAPGGQPRPQAGTTEDPLALSAGGEIAAALGRQAAAEAGITNPKEAYAFAHASERAFYVPHDDQLFVLGPDQVYREADENGVPIAGGVYYDPFTDQVTESYREASGEPEDTSALFGEPRPTKTDEEVTGTGDKPEPIPVTPPGFIGGFHPQYRVPNPRRTAFEKAMQWGGINPSHYEYIFGGIKETKKPLYLEGDQYGMFSGKSVEEIASTQLMLIDAGLLSPGDLQGLGNWGTVEANAMTQLMTEANGFGITYVEAGARRQEAVSQLPEPAEDDEASAISGAGGFNATLPIPAVQEFTVPDYATLKGQARSLFRDALGRDPHGYELALFADSLLADYQADAETQLGRAEKDYQQSVRIGQRRARKEAAMGGGEEGTLGEDETDEEIRRRLEDLADDGKLEGEAGVAMEGDIWLRDASGRMVRTSTVPGKKAGGEEGNHVIKAPKFRGRVVSEVDPMARTIERFLASYQPEIDQNERSAALNANFQNLVSGLASIEATVEG